MFSSSHLVLKLPDLLGSSLLFARKLRSLDGITTVHQGAVLPAGPALSLRLPLPSALFSQTVTYLGGNSHEFYVYHQLSLNPFIFLWIHFAAYQSFYYCHSLSAFQLGFPRVFHTGVAPDSTSPAFLTSATYFIKSIQVISFGL